MRFYVIVFYGIVIIFQYKVAQHNNASIFQTEKQVSHFIEYPKRIKKREGRR